VETADFGGAAVLKREVGDIGRNRPLHRPETRIRLDDLFLTEVSSG
jgi:hypothetical protein